MFARLWILLGIVCGMASFVPVRAVAQTDCDLDPYYPGCYWEVMVRPDGGPDTLASSSSGSFTFWVVNTGTNFDTYDFSCGGTGSITCTGVGVSEWSLLSHDSIQVGVSYSSSGGGEGSVTLSATGRAIGTSDGGSSVLLVDAGMTLNAEVHNGYHHNAALCAMACFNVTVGYSTPAYISMDVPRSAALVYSSGSAQARYLVQVNVRDFKDEGGQYASKISIRLRRPNGTLVKLTNGTDSVFFASSQGNGPVKRLGVQFDDTTLTTGAYDYTVVVRAHWTSSVKELTAPVRVLVVNESQSPYGAGWTVAGAHRLALAGTSGLVTWDGTGTIQYFTKQPCNATGCTFTPPLGDFDTLRFDSVAARADVNDAYTRTTVDRTKLVFDDQGRLRYVADPFNNKARYYWRTGPKLDSVVDPVGKRIEFAYTNGKLASIRDVPGNRTTYVTINGANNLTRVQDAVGGYPLDSLTYDAGHRILSRRDRRGSRWSYAYDYTGRLASDSTPAVTAEGTSQRLVTLHGSTLAGMVGIGTSGSPSSSLNASVADRGTVTPPVGSQRKFSVDAFGAIRQVLAPASEFASYSRNAHSQITTTTDSAGPRLFTWTGPRLTQEWVPSNGEIILYEWNTSTNRMTRRYGNRTTETRYFYNSAGIRLDSTKVGNNPVSKLTYDGHGLLITAADPRGHTTTFYRASSGLQNIDSVKTGSRRIKYAYDTLGRMVTTTNAGNVADTTSYDALNRVVRRAGPLQSVVTYGYGDSLHLTRVTDAKGQVTEFEKNAIGWDTARVDPRGQREHYRHNKAGQLLVWRNRRGDSTVTVYDSVGRPISRTLADGRVSTFEYHGTWMVASNSESTDTTRYRPDTMFQIAVRSGTVYTVRSVFDSTNKDLVVAFWRSGEPAISVRYDLDTLLRVQRIIPGTASPDTLLYDGDGAMNKVGLHGWTDMRHLLRPGHDLAAATYSHSGVNTIFGAQYVHDSLGRKRQRVAGSRTETEGYSYDALGRLTGYRRHSASPACDLVDTLSEFGSPCTSQTTQLAADTFTYDVVGNRTDGLQAGDSIALGNRVTGFDGYLFEYDADGNVTRKHKANGSFDQRLYWNSTNQLDSAWTWKDGSGQTVRFGYDGVGRRVRKSFGSTTIRYIYDGHNVLAEYNQDLINLRYYSYYPGVDRPHSISGSYYMYDGSGNVLGLATGSFVNARYRFNPWGVADTATYWPSEANFIRFGGREFDKETGLYHNRARYYDPEIGRFLSEDPIGISGGLNTYAYAGNDPINKRDPSGLDDGTPIDGVTITAEAYDWEAFWQAVAADARLNSFLWMMMGAGVYGVRSMDADGLGEGWDQEIFQAYVDNAHATPADEGERQEVQCMAQSFLLPFNVAADVSGLKVIGKGIAAAWRGFKLIRTNRALNLAFGGIRHIITANWADLGIELRTRMMQYATGSAQLNAPLGVVGDAVDGGVTPGSVAQDVATAFVPGSNTISAVGNVKNACGL